MTENLLAHSPPECAISVLLRIVSMVGGVLAASKCPVSLSNMTQGENLPSNSVASLAGNCPSKTLEFISGPLTP
ncbi:hypothetical protein IW262DRAFT_1378652 [Armillaria fumosa]|nr:hypothetical protein IW262DRAFT_1378652 [Armillaria fumosa]